MHISRTGDDNIPAEPGSLHDLALKDTRNPHQDHTEEDDDDPASAYSRVDDVRIAQEFIEALRNADINNGDLSPEAVDNLLHPPEYPLELDDEADADLIQCLRLFLHGHNSANHYNETINDLKIRHPEDDLLSFDQLKRTIRQLTGITPIVNDMCRNSCLAYTGPLRERESCHRCGEPRHDPVTGKPQLELLTIPIGFSIQALKRHVTTAEQMEYFWRRSQELLEELRQNGEIELINDIVCGTDILLAIDRGEIHEDDTVIMFSFDGAQIYRNKQSDCWISICVTPGPKKIKIVESCLFPSLHHVAAVNKKGGLPVWNAAKKSLKKSKLYIVLATADGPGMVYLNGLVGHSGKNGCRLWCGLVGRHKPGAPMHYPVLAKPNGYHVAGCDHPDISPHIVNPIDPKRYQEHLKRVLCARTQAEYEYQRRETGICKPSIFSGLPDRTYLGIPNMFPVDIMHLVLNLADLLISLWRGKIDCSKEDRVASWPWAVLVDQAWQIHGRDIAGATPFLPGSFDRPPRNPAEKINSGYKAWEFLLYIFAIGPGYLYGLLPDPFWRSYCKLVAAVRIIYQRRITRDQLPIAHQYLIEFVAEFEALYVNCRCDRIHFVQPIVHVLVHLALEAIRVGPGITSSQWTMERCIGNLVEEIRQDSTPYANLSRRAVECAEVARSLWKESLKPITKIRIARRVKLRYKNQIEFGEVRYYFRYQISKMDIRTLAAISLYTRPDEELLHISAGTLWSCRHQGDNAVIVVDVKCIAAVVAVVPHSTGILGDSWKERVFVVEKPGLDISIMAGVVEDISEENE
ncbi:hypothetical protein C0991_001710 [Blastosporella zonata]|nr:hypothetical protein C0991_001710 [Blastosporella zonata]